MSEAACAHTKIKEIRWSEGGSAQSSKFMCLDCNSDFILLTPKIRQFLNAQRLNDQSVNKSPDDIMYK